MRSRVSNLLTVVDPLTEVQSLMEFLDAVLASESEDVREIEFHVICKTHLDKLMSEITRAYDNNREAQGYLVRQLVRNWHWKRRLEGKTSYHRARARYPIRGWTVCDVHHQSFDIIS